MSHGLDQTATCAADPSNLNAQTEPLFPSDGRRDNAPHGSMAGVRIYTSECNLACVD